MTVQAKVCKDCEPGSKRPAPNPGPRCQTHHRAEKKRRSKVNHERMVQKTYGLGPGDYDRLYALQGGRCAICPRATGASKRLAVDHDHKTGLPRGLLCSVCNRMLGHARDDAEFFERAREYLISPPAQNLTTPKEEK
jgi:hypothetical protein